MVRVMNNKLEVQKNLMSEDESFGHDDLAGKYLTFAISNEFYGIAIGKVKEIIGASNLEIISVPDMPDYARGVINLRDKVIPVFSLRARFGVDEVEFSDYLCFDGG